jgi:hypothetical protein
LLAIIISGRGVACDFLLDRAGRTVKSANWQTIDKSGHAP